MVAGRESDDARTSLFISQLEEPIQRAPYLKAARVLQGLRFDEHTRIRSEVQHLGLEDRSRNDPVPQTAVGFLDIARSWQYVGHGYRSLRVKLTSTIVDDDGTPMGFEREHGAALGRQSRGCTRNCKRLVRLQHCHWA